jgi:drug/metabolite transporter (DMT)-like permease
VRLKTLIPKIGGILVLLLGLYMAVADGRYFTPWLAILWGIIGAIALLQTEVRNGKVQRRLPPVVQFMLVAFLIVAAMIATNWSALGNRDLIQWGYAIFTLPAYGDGLVWGWSSIKPVLRRK